MAEGCGPSGERESCSAGAGESARWRLKANSRNAMRLIIAPTARQSAPTSTWAVATSAALFDQIVAAPSSACVRINPSQPSASRLRQVSTAKRAPGGPGSEGDRAKNRQRQQPMRHLQADLKGGDRVDGQ